MIINSIIEHPERCYHCTLDDEAFNGYFIEIKDDGTIISAYLCEDGWPRRKEFVFYDYSARMDLDAFIEALNHPIISGYIRHVFKRLTTLEDIPS